MRPNDGRPKRKGPARTGCGSSRAQLLAFSRGGETLSEKTCIKTPPRRRGSGFRSKKFCSTAKICKSQLMIDRPVRIWSNMQCGERWGGNAHLSLPLVGGIISLTNTVIVRCRREARTSRVMVARSLSPKPSRWEARYSGSCLRSLRVPNGVASSNQELLYPWQRRPTT